MHDEHDCGAAVEPPSLGRGVTAAGSGVSRSRCEKGELRGAAEAVDDRLVAACVNDSRSACLLPFLNGAAPVCYGVPTRWRSRFLEGAHVL